MSNNQPNSDDGFANHAAGKKLPNLTNFSEPISTGTDNMPQLQAGEANGQYTSDNHNQKVAPVAPQPALWAKLPKEMRERPQWLLARADKYGNLKVPTSVLADGSLVDGSSTNRATWLVFDYALAAAKHHKLGLGYVLAADDPFTCVDLDVKNINNAPTEPEIWSTQADLDRFSDIVRDLESYTELSQSGQGLHVWALGKVGPGRKRSGVEIYSQERFIACTGNIYKNLPISDGGIVLSNMYASMERNDTSIELDEDVEETMSDTDIVNKLMAAVNGDKYNALCKGDWVAMGFPSQSEADLALISMYTFWSKNNEQCRRLFRASPLGKREKATKNNVYLNRTLKLIRGRQKRDVEAVKHGAQVAAAILAYAQMKQVNSARVTTSRELRLVHANEIASRPPMKWLVRGVLPEKGVGAIFGPPGSGKSFLVLDLLAAIAEGAHWFGIETKAVPVVYASLEGQAGMPQRICAYRTRRGILERIWFIEQPIDIRQSENLQQVISLIRNAGLSGGIVCIDTLAASSPGMDENTSADMGELISALQELQIELDSFVLFVHHTGKDTSRGMRGWSGLNGALDCAIQTSREKDEDGEESNHRQWKVTKAKDGQDGRSEHFMLEEVDLGIDEDAYPITSCVIGYTTYERASVSEHDTDIDDFVWKWLKEEVANGELPSGRSLDAKRDHEQIKSRRKLTQAQLRDSIHRLKSAGRIVAEKKEGLGYGWLNAVEVSRDT